MNIYKNLMFLHGHFVDPRDADDEPDTTGPAEPVASTRVAAASSASHPAQARGRVDWRQWLRLWPAESARVDARDAAGIDARVDCGVGGCR